MIKCGQVSDFGVSELTFCLKGALTNPIYKVETLIKKEDQNGCF